jgi:hypothetical protein
LKGQELPSCDFVVEKATSKQHAALSKNQWPLLKRTPRTQVLSGRRINLKNLKPFMQLLHLQRMKIVLVMKNMTRKKGFYEKIDGLLEIIPKR